MQELIKITENSGKKAVSAKELYLGLELNKAHWSRWYPTNIQENDFFLENEHWQGFTIMENGNETMDFAISIDFAKHIAMMARTEKSHEYRNYFLECEKQINTPKQIDSKMLFQIAQALEEKEKENQVLRLDVAVKDQLICEMQPKATYYDLILQSKAALSVSQIAKDYGMSATKLNEILHELKVQYKQGDTWLLYQGYAANGYTSSKTHNYINNKAEHCSKLHTYWTQKGRLFIYDLLKNKKDIVPLIER
jgi:anti-repressor protein